jgi:hypothetical protein
VDNDTLFHPLRGHSADTAEGARRL